MRLLVLPRRRRRQPSDRFHQGVHTSVHADQGEFIRWASESSPQNHHFSPSFCALRVRQSISTRYVPTHCSLFPPSALSPPTHTHFSWQGLQSETSTPFVKCMRTFHSNGLWGVLPSGQPAALSKRGTEFRFLTLLTILQSNSNPRRPYRR